MTKNKIQKVSAYITTDGKLHLYEVAALNHQKQLDDGVVFQLEWDTLMDKLEKEYPDQYFWLDGWACDESPIKECVFHDTDWGEPCCFYCGQPEERK